MRTSGIAREIGCEPPTQSPGLALRAGRRTDHTGVDRAGEGSRRHHGVYEGVIKSLFELADDAIELIDDPAQQARAARSLKSDQLAIRAQRLKLSKMSASVIGKRMARDDGREEPYDARQVRRWLARQVGKAD